MVTLVLVEWCSGVSYLSYSLVGSELSLTKFYVIFYKKNGTFNYANIHESKSNPTFLTILYGKGLGAYFLCYFSLGFRN